MRIDGSVLRDYLDSFCHVAYCKVGNLTFDWVDFVSLADPLKPSTMYVCSAEEYSAIVELLQKHNRQDGVINFLVVKGFDPKEDEDTDTVASEAVLDRNSRTGGNTRIVMVCRSSLTAFDLAKRLQDYVRKITEWKLTMDNEMLCGGMHQEMLVLSEPILGTTILVVDCDFNLVAHTAGPASMSGVLHSAIERGGFDATALAKLVEAGIITAGHMPVSGKTQRHIWARVDGFEILAHPFYNKNAFSALLIMACDERKPTRGLEFLFDILAEAIGHCVAKDVQQRLRPGSREERLVISLIENKLPKGDQLDRMCQEHGIPSNGTLRVCHFIVGDNCSPGYAEKEIRSTVGKCWISSRGSSITALCCDEEVTNDEKLCKNRGIRSLLADNDLFLAASNVYHDVSRTGIAYHQARIAARFSEEKQHTSTKNSAENDKLVLFWKIAPLWALKQGDMADRYLMDHLSQENEITELSLTGQPSSVSDVTVLYHYLYNNCDARLTSDGLYMHRNTVYYRIKRIQGILDLDIDDPDARSYMRFLFALMKAYGQEIK